MAGFHHIIVSILVASLLCGSLVSSAGDTVRPGLENIEFCRPTKLEEQFLQAVSEPLMSGMDVSAAMQDWFDGRLLETQHKDATQKWASAIAKLSNVKPLEVKPFAPIPDASFTKITPLQEINLPGVTASLLEWQSGKLKQYGIILEPKEKVANARYPLILYCHGAAYGIPTYFLPFLADMVKQGYVIIAPAMRGEPLFQMEEKANGELLKCEGEIENLDGEVDDCLSMLSATWKLPYIRPNEFAMLGHSFGAGVGILAAERAGKAAKAVVSYDAWLVNPQRYYWDRMRRAARNWDSWEDYCNHPVEEQLQGLVKRSAILHADALECPILLFIGGAYRGSVFHKSHEDLIKRLDALHKPYQYQPVPNGDHNFVLRLNSRPARFALFRQRTFLATHFPPYHPEKEEKGP